VPSVALILAGLTLLIWIVLTFFRGAFWQLRAFDDDIAPHQIPSVWPRVVCVMPARNEAETIARAFPRLLGKNIRANCAPSLWMITARMRRLIWQEPLRRKGRDGTRKDPAREALQSGWTVTLGFAARDGEL